MSASSRSVLVVAGLATAALAWFLWSDPGGSAPVAATPEEAEQPEALVVAEPSEATHREAVEAAAHELPDEPTAEEPPELFSVRGRVLDVGGMPLSVPVLAGIQDAGHSDAAGRFEIKIAIGVNGISLVAEGEGWSSVRESQVTVANHNREHLLVAARAFDLGGTVVDAAGSPVMGAMVRVGIWSETLHDFPLPLDMARPTLFSTVTDEHGRFALAAAPCPGGATIVAQKQGYASGQVAAPTHASLGLYIVLTAKEPGSQISGIVLRSDHRPAEGAKVQFNSRSTTSDATGVFALPLPSNPDADQPLVAGLQGHGVVLLPRFGEQILTAAPNPPTPVTLVLPAKPRDLAGRVINENGEGQPDWVVSVMKGTEITRRRMPPVLAEGFGGGAARQTTAEDGSFRLSNLLTRDYVVRAYQRKTLLTIFSEPTAPGTEDMELIARDDLTYPRLRGKVLSRGGIPLAGVQIVPGLILHKTKSGAAWESGEAAVTDELGVFEFAGFPRSHVHLDIGGESVVPERFEVGTEQDVENLTFMVSQRCHIRVEVQGANLNGLDFELHDRDGKRLPIYSFSARMSSSSSRKSLDLGRAPVSAVSEDAVELLVFRSGQEPIARQKVTLSPGQVNELRVVLP